MTHVSEHILRPNSNTICCSHCRIAARAASGGDQLFGRRERSLPALVHLIWKPAEYHSRLRASPLLVAYSLRSIARMQPSRVQKFSDQLQHERRALLRELPHNREGFKSITETAREEFEGQAQRERDAILFDSRDEMAQSRLRDIDAALARIEAGTFGQL